MNNLITIISYFEPISTLLEKLEKYDREISSEVKSDYYVNGYASAICLLAVVCLESYSMRVRYINNASQKQIDRINVSKYLKLLYQDFPYEDELTEIFILRDVLAHNHLLEISYSWANEKDMILQEVNKRSKGDKKYRQLVDIEKNVTKTLGLNVNPIKVGSTDVKIVLQTMWKVLLFLENKNINQCCVSQISAIHKGKIVKFGKIIGMPETCT